MSPLPGRVTVALEVMSHIGVVVGDDHVEAWKNARTPKQAALLSASENVLLLYLLGEEDYGPACSTGIDDDEHPQGVLIPVA